jgi:dephospho-CoA kinase
MISVGLTGGIGSGKSTVSELFASYGALVVDSDRISREVVEPGTPGLAAVVAEFGEEVLRPDGTLDRPKLGAIVFGDQARLQALNAIVHPLVGRRSAELEAQAGPDDVVIHDVPLLAENGLAQLYDVVAVVDVAPQTQLHRLVQLRGMEADEARSRMAVQATREQRLAVADLVIDNDGPLDALEPQVRTVWEKLRERGTRVSGCSVRS